MTVTHSHPPLSKKQNCRPDFFYLLRSLVDSIPIHNSRFAHFIASVIPRCCPFERDINLFGRTLFRIPPLCELNPLYDETVALRFRALNYLADVCGEDIGRYIC